MGDPGRLHKRIEMISGTVCKISGCNEDELVISIQTNYNGKRYVELQALIPLESSSVCETIAGALFKKGINVIVQPNAKDLFWRKEFEEKDLESN